MSSRSGAMILAVLGLALSGCDGQDPERLGRVGKKLVEKSRKLAEDSDLPRITITPKGEKTVVEEKRGNENTAEIPRRGN